MKYSITADEFCRFFINKVDSVRQSTAGSPPSSFTVSRSSSTFQNFDTATIDEVVMLINRLPDKTSAADPLPTLVLKAVSNLLSQYVTALFNLSTSCGRFLSPFKVFRHPKNHETRIGSRRH
jgi:hypothetical protein